MSDNQDNQDKRFNNRIPFGILMVTLGAVLLLRNLNMLPPEVPAYVFSWKMLLIIIGLYSLIVFRKMGGIIMVGVGAYFLIPEVVGMPAIDFHLFWPGIFILLGLGFIFGKKGKKFKNFSNQKRSVNSDMIDVSVVMSGDSRVVSSYNFTGGNIHSIMGGVELDLTNCTLAKGAVLHISVIMGGISLIVPREWNVRSELTPIMGGVEDGIFNKPDTYIDPAAELLLQGKIVMGGVEIKRI